MAQTYWTAKRSDVRRPEAPARWAASTSTAPTTVLAVIMKTPSTIIAESSVVYFSGRKQTESQTSTPRKSLRRQVGLAAAAEERERVGDDAGQRLEVPGEPGEEEEGRGGRAAFVQRVLQEVADRQAGPAPPPARASST